MGIKLTLDAHHPVIKGVFEDPIYLARGHVDGVVRPQPLSNLEEGVRTGGVPSIHVASDMFGSLVRLNLLPPFKRFKILVAKWRSTRPLAV